MNAEPAALLLQATLWLSAALIVVLVLRPVVRRLTGSRNTFLLWALVPACLVAVLLPARTVVVPAATGLVEIAASPSVAPATAGPIAGMAPATALLGLWGLGVLLAIGLLLVRQYRFRLGLGRMRPLSPASRVWRSENGRSGPATIGLLRPRIVLPIDFRSRYTASERRLILRHERTHLARLDPLWSFLAAALQCLFWFNPLVHLAAHRFRTDQELACDEVVMARMPGRRRHYADALLKAQIAAPGLLEPALRHGFGTHPLKARIQFLFRRAPSASRRRAGAFGIGLVIVAAAISAWAANPQPRAPAHGDEITLEVHVTIDGITRSVQAWTGDFASARIEELGPMRYIGRGTFYINHAEADGGWSSELTIDRVERDKFIVSAILYRDGTVLDSPLMIMSSDAPASMEVTRRDGGGSLYRIEVVPRP